MTHRPRVDRSAAFATGAVVLAVVALIGTAAVALTSGRGESDATFGELDLGPDANRGSTNDSPGQTHDKAIADPNADPNAVAAAASQAMAAVTSVRFSLARTGAAIFIDEFERIALDSLLGRFTVPNQAQAELTVTINDTLTTKLGAVAIDEQVWISNPVTGEFEILNDGYDMDPSRFFDPTGGWKPLLANLADVTLIGIEDRGGDRYHIRGTAPAEQVRNITVGLVRDQDVPVDVWVHPDTNLVTAAEFTTVLDGAVSDWTLTLSDYGEIFRIEPPEQATP
jgi:lipoprotein LprG